MRKTLTEFTSDSAGATAAFAAEFAQQLQPDTVVLLYGDLGAGKTTFIRGLARGLGITEPIRSPTFTLIHEYTIQQPPPLSGLPFFHIDLYRIETPQQLLTLGLEEVLERGGITAIEWAERLSLASLSPRPTHLWEVHLHIEGDHQRRILIR
ncbi:MAG: tRNA (adenosine(37)-N6)-threonylcarbamoyltransferase complex ATPase subunit type 1 TsaE [Fimbriimonadales bacterium]|nr:tRNA (adenosine(37)-N6)-threonylcarbamoyltransferase complex ATPase subunit type 1 TsaE [Fimbriimonadales bacterium]MDW8051273.1 tRNA (adenosine(37)-N6)-threonylcarbamoyltransferase complex ATPase subunit type 1 TsaE [Armatimonadota bacterium]